MRAMDSFNYSRGLAHARGRGAASGWAGVPASQPESRCSFFSSLVKNFRVH